MASKGRPPHRESEAPAPLDNARHYLAVQLRHSAEHGPYVHLKRVEVKAVLDALDERDRLLGLVKRTHACLDTLITTHQRMDRDSWRVWLSYAEETCALADAALAANNRHLDTHRGELGDDR